MTYSVSSRPSAKQNAELTFRFNRHKGRHGWLRLTPAYSVKLVSGILSSAEARLRVLDPFSGTATTPLCAAYEGHEGIGVEINPFLLWFGNAKLATYSPQTIECARELLAAFCDREGDPATVATPPPIHNAQRWWDPEPLDFLCRLKAAIENAAPESGPVRDLLLVVFCRLVIRFSNAAFNHQSMSFKHKSAKGTEHSRQGLLFDNEPDLRSVAVREAEFVLDGAGDNPSGGGRVVNGDSRATSASAPGPHDLLVTSPPYPNRMSYIRELRPYMYWLGYLSTGREAGEMDWSAIGGTWGIATSRLADWQRSREGFYPPYFERLLGKIGRASNKNGALLANYVAKYFEDMWSHIRDVHRIVSDGGEVHYVVGNSTFYDVLVPVEELYRDMLAKAGFRKTSIKRIRKRNSKKELYEFDVTGAK